MSKILGVAGFFVTIVIFVGLVFSLPIMFLWNTFLVPAIPGINEISWQQAWGLYFLFSILFKSSDTLKE